MGKVQTIKGGVSTGQVKNSPFKDAIWKKGSAKSSGSNSGSY